MEMQPFETELVETQAGTYTIQIHVDEYGGMGDPLQEYDHEGMSAYLYRRGFNGWEPWYSDIAGATSGAAYALDQIIYRYGGYGDAEGVVRRFRKWQVISGDRHTLVEGSLNRRGGADHYLVLVNPAWYWSNPELAAKSEMEQWRAWADGEVFGYAVEGPDGQHIDSCWGFIGYDERDGYMLDQARESVTIDAEQRVGAANLVGAGFIGII